MAEWLALILGIFVALFPAGIWLGVLQNRVKNLEGVVAESKEKTDGVRDEMTAVSPLLSQINESLKEMKADVKSLKADMDVMKIDIALLKKEAN